MPNQCMELTIPDAAHAHVERARSRAGYGGAQLAEAESASTVRLRMGDLHTTASSTDSLV